MKEVLVVGATGRQGGAVTETLLDRGYRVRALVRSTQSPLARRLAERGVGLRQGDLDDEASIVSAARGADAAFGMTTPFQAGVEAEARQGINLVQALRRAGIEHFVYSSVAGADRATDIPHFESKFQVERRASELGIPHTVVAPVTFFENVSSPWQIPMLRQGVVAAGFPPDLGVQHVAIADIASFTALVLENPARFDGRRIEIASEAISGRRQAEILAKVTGRDMRYVRQGIEQIRGWGGEDMVRMVEWINAVGYSANIDELRHDFPEVGWHTFERWALAQDWTVLDAADEPSWGWSR